LAAAPPHIRTWRDILQQVAPPANQIPGTVAGASSSAAGSAADSVDQKVKAADQALVSGVGRLEAIVQEPADDSESSALGHIVNAL